MDEGTFRFDDLSKHIAGQGLRVLGRMQLGRVDYDSETNRCIGFVLPFDDQGLALVDTFVATSFVAIEKMFSSAAIAKYA